MLNSKYKFAFYLRNKNHLKIYKAVFDFMFFQAVVSKEKYYYCTIKHSYMTKFNFIPCIFYKHILRLKINLCRTQLVLVFYCIVDLFLFHLK